MKRSEALLNEAIKAVKADQPDNQSLSASAGRVSDRLEIAMKEDAVIESIQNCHDVQQLLPSYRQGSLSNARAMLVKAHLSDCGACLRSLREGAEAGAVDWSTPEPASSVFNPQRFGWAFAFSLGVLICLFFVYKAYWEVPAGVRAEVQSIDGSAFLISDGGNRQLTPGFQLREGDRVRTTGASHAVIRLSDGSIVEVNERSALGVGARGHDMTVALDGGDVIVQAAKRSSGHLYVKTSDCRVAVTGTVFSVDAGIKGSRVAVLQGAVQVTHSGLHSLLHAGDQMTTNENLAPAPFEQQIAWSQDRGKYLQLLAQFSTLGNRIGGIPFPQPRYGSDLLTRVPADTALYISIPNLGEFLSEANSIFHDQLNQSSVLQEWWSQGHRNNSADLDALVEKLHDASQYLGDEVVIVGVKQSDTPQFAIVADVQKSGLDNLLKSQFTTAAGGVTVFDEQSLAASGASSSLHGVYALVRQHEVVFSNAVDMLKRMDARLNAGSSGFAAGAFGSQIAAAYDRGAGIILAADLHQMLVNAANRTGKQSAHKRAIENSGIEGAQYLIAEHREMNGLPQNHLNLQFTGTRQRVASWLASPAPIGSLDFVSPNAAIAVAMLSKDPKAIADDILSMASTGGQGHNADWSELEAKLQINVRDDLIANLGGDFLISLDGPVLPTPSWKMVVEINDANRLENTLERLNQAIANQPHGKDFHQISIEPSEVDGQRFFALRDGNSGTVVANYTYSGGFMIIAPTRAMLIDALHTHASGNSLARSAAFRALLPKDENENYSAVAYQNLSPVLTPLLSQFSGESAIAIQKLAADSRPTAICAWGKESRIEVASDSRLFGFDFLTLGALVNSRNKLAAQSVSQ
jgi:hypothetical protein